MEQVIQIDEETTTPLSIHGINKINTTQSGFTFGAPIQTTQSGFVFGASSQSTSCFQKPNIPQHGIAFGIQPQTGGLQMCGDMRPTQHKVEQHKVERHPETGQPINRMPFQFGITNDRKQHIDSLYNELNNMRNSIDKCNKTLDSMCYESSNTNLREYYNNITKSIDKFYETLRFIN